jgi:hypothetical protein
MVRCLFLWRKSVNRFGKPIIFVLATIYFLVDAVFIAVAKPIGNWIAEQRLFGGVQSWITSLRPYPTLALFIAPLLILEPIKPAAAYMVATGHFLAGATLFVVGEILKLVLVERLFAICRDKLLSIAAFAWAHHKFCQITELLASTEAWQFVRRLSFITKAVIRGYVVELGALYKTRRISMHPR